MSYSFQFIDTCPFSSQICFQSQLNCMTAKVISRSRRQGSRHSTNDGIASVRIVFCVRPKAHRTCSIHLFSCAPNAPLQLRALSEKEASRQLQAVVRWL